MAIGIIHKKSAQRPNGGNGVFCTLAELFSESLKSGKSHLHLRRKALAPKGGQKRSSVRGRGMEFFESRPYVIQDEVRHIDWKVSARLNGIYSKIFIEEKDRPIYLVVDLRCQMFFGSRQCFKSVLAAKIAARLSCAAINGGDTIGGFIFTNDHSSEISPSSTRNGLARFFGALADKSQETQQNDEDLQKDAWTAIFAQIRHRVRKGCAIFLLSDFYGLDERCRNSLYALRKKADIFALKISDPLEQVLPPIGLVGAAFAHKKVYFNSDDPFLREKFASYYQNQEKFADELFASLNIPKFKFSTAGNLDVSLKPLFAGIW